MQTQDTDQNHEPAGVFAPASRRFVAYLRSRSQGTKKQSQELQIITLGERANLWRDRPGAHIHFHFRSGLSARRPLAAHALPPWQGARALQCNHKRRSELRGRKRLHASTTTIRTVPQILKLGGEGGSKKHHRCRSPSRWATHAELRKHCPNVRSPCKHKTPIRITSQLACARQHHDDS